MYINRLIKTEMIKVNEKNESEESLDEVNARLEEDTRKERVVRLLDGMTVRIDFLSVGCDKNSVEHFDASIIRRHISHKELGELVDSLESVAELLVIDKDPTRIMGGGM